MTDQQPDTAEQVDVEAIAKEILDDVCEALNGPRQQQIAVIAAILRRHLQGAGGMLGASNPSQPATPDPPAPVRCFRDPDIASRMYVLTDDPAIIFDGGYCGPSIVQREWIERQPEITFPAAIALLADRPEQQATLRAMGEGTDG